MHKSKEGRASRLVKFLLRDMKQLGSWARVYDLPISKIMTAGWTSPMSKTYRVFVDSDTGSVEVFCFGITRVDTDCEGVYKSVHDLPIWMRDKLAVLNMVEVNPPQEEIVGVGVRVDANTFWIYR